MGARSDVRPLCDSLRMERYIGVSQARAYFADVLNTGAYASERVVIRRRGKELGAFVGCADLDFLRRHKERSRFPEPPPVERPPDPLEADLIWRENRLHWQEEYVRRAGRKVEDDQDLVEERAYLERLRAWIGPSPARDSPD